jgi:hypothetical protein
VLRHNARAAFFVEVGMIAAMVAVLVLIPSFVKYVFAAGLGLFVLLFGIAGFWRDQVVIDLGSRQWRRRSGFLGSTVETRGALDDIPAVEMTLVRQPGSDHDQSSWNVSFQAPVWKTPVVVETHAQEEAGYRALERWAKKLRRDAVDRTGVQEVRTAWDALDRPLRDRVPAEVAEVAEVAAVSELPPAGSRIVVTREGTARRIVLPPIGWNAGATVVSIFGLFFCGFGTVAMLAGLHVITGVKVNGRLLDRPDWGFTAIASFFALIGWAIIGAMFVGSRAREYVEEARDVLVFGVTWLGLQWSAMRMPKHEIEEVDRAASSRSRSAGPCDVRVRSDVRVVRLGRYLPEADQRWLENTLAVMAKR